jgi:Terpene cyclase DEP1
MRWLYLLLALIGAVLPYSQFLPWLGAHGLDVRLLLADLFSGRISAFFGLDVLVSAVVVLCFIFHEGTQRRIRMLWLPVAATCLVGVSCGLPLFLYLRERALVRDT